MFVKLIVLILALGSTGVGVLSVRQARFEAANEMAQSRLRTRQLDRRSMELRAQISEGVTPSMIQQAIDTRLLVNETEQRIDLIDPYEPEPIDDAVAIEETPQQTSQANYWTLDDGTRVYVIDADED